MERLATPRMFCTSPEALDAHLLRCSPSPPRPPSREIIERLARPRPPFRAKDAFLPTNETPETLFSPKIGVPWIFTDMSGIPFHHADTAFKPRKGSNTCGHLNDDHYCIECDKFLCRRCHNSDCPALIQEWKELEESPEHLVQWLRNKGLLSLWQARAMDRCSAPVSERLVPKPKPRPSTAIRGRRSTRGLGISDHGKSNGDADISKREKERTRQATSEAFDRLTSPRKVKEAPEQEYLPGMIRMPGIDELGKVLLHHEPIEGPEGTAPSEAHCDSCHQGPVIAKARSQPGMVWIQRHKICGICSFALCERCRSDQCPAATESWQKQTVDEKLDVLRDNELIPEWYYRALLRTSEKVWSRLHPPRTVPRATYRRYRDGTPLEEKVKLRDKKAK